MDILCKPDNVELLHAAFRTLKSPNPLTIESFVLLENITGLVELIFSPQLLPYYLLFRYPIIPHAATECVDWRHQFLSGDESARTTMEGHIVEIVACNESGNAV